MEGSCDPRGNLVAELILNRKSGTDKSSQFTERDKTRFPIGWNDGDVEKEPI